MAGLPAMACSAMAEHPSLPMSLNPKSRTDKDGWCRCCMSAADMDEAAEAELDCCCTNAAAMMLAPSSPKSLHANLSTDSCWFCCMSLLIKSASPNPKPRLDKSTTNSLPLGIANSNRSRSTCLIWSDMDVQVYDVDSGLTLRWTCTKSAPCFWAAVAADAYRFDCSSSCCNAFRIISSWPRCSCEDDGWKWSGLVVVLAVLVVSC
mmetsp:Transcript_8597/g.24721  ORF Transcript_8597/g.24721 Transcript_8597/m.24721 type:complete len:206 (-) Transcript_8597:1074-1691(-)